MAGLGIIGVAEQRALHLRRGPDQRLQHGSHLCHSPAMGDGFGLVLGTERPRVRGILGVLLAMLGVV
jgi:hypothetical protein